MSACTGNVTPAVSAAGGSVADACRALYAEVDARVAATRVGDAQYARIDGYPYLRIDRFLADAAPGLDADGADFTAWAAALRMRGADARAVELGNLPDSARAALGAGVAGRLDACADVLLRTDLATAEGRRRLLAAAWVPDDYSTAKRVLGLYPFTSLPFMAGVTNLHAEIQADFSRPQDGLPTAGELVRYRPPEDVAPLSAASVRALLAEAERDAFGAPVIAPAERDRLFATFAPTYVIDVAGDDDRIGTPYWSEDGLPSVDVGRPVVYRRVSHARFGGRTLVQLVYSVWFPSRPAEGALDLLSGRLDGLTVRVTLADDGRPLIYDSMHNCGCYHLFLPTTRLVSKPASGDYEEPPLVPQRVEPRVAGPSLRIASRTHYLQRLYFEAPRDDGRTYAFRDDDALRSLVLVDGGRRSLFDPQGLVPGSERAERWLFWPMGIAEPGAMRQWGRHATAFVGTRHFDDPHLIERYFAPAD